MGVERTRAIFKEAFADGRRKKWRLNHSPLFLDFLEGKVDFSCTAWGHPLLFSFRLAAAPATCSPTGYVGSYRELLGGPRSGRTTAEAATPSAPTAWPTAATSRTAVMSTMGSMRESLRAASRALGRAGSRARWPANSKRSMTLMSSLTQDLLGRRLRDLRVSVTDRCNFRCRYCMPTSTFGPGFRFLPRSEILDFEEITRVVEAATALGVTKVRIHRWGASPAA